MKNTVLLVILLFCLFSTSRTSAQVVINEIMASNAITIVDPDFQNSSDWIELYNAGFTAADLTNYTLTDNASDTLKWTFPAGTTLQPGTWLLVWADGKNTGLHTNFSLSKLGEEVALYNAAGVKLDAVVYPTEEVDISYGRKTDASVVWGYFTKPTPGASNNTPAYTGFAQFSTYAAPKGGFFTDPVTVTLSTNAGIGTVRYTLDGSEPVETSPAYTAPITVNSTTVVRARLFRPGMIPGPVLTNTYFINEQFDTRKLPVMSLSTDSKYFYDPQIGLYVQSFKPEWEYPIHLEFYEPDGVLGFHFDGGVQIGGENAWELPQKLLNIHARKQYGGGAIEYQVFPDDKRNYFEDIILRCSGNDWSNTFFRDGMEQGLTQPYMDVDIQGFRPCAVFFNGQYLGLHNLRSREDVSYLQEKYGFDADSIDMIENDGGVLEGDNVAYQEMVSRLTNGVSNDADFAALANVMDVRNYSDYITSQIFCANSSWGHNITCYRNKKAGGKFRWFLYDYDRGFFTNNTGNYELDWATTSNGASWSNPDWATMFLRKMLENNTYKQQFIQRFSDHLYVTYNPQRVNKAVDRHAANIRVEMQNYQISRWVGTTSNYGNAIPSFAYWENEVAALKTFVAGRNAFMFTNLQNFFGIAGPSGLTLGVSAPEHGYITIDSMPVPEYPWAGKFLKNYAFTLHAYAKPGFQFVRWEKLSASVNTLFGPGSDWKYSDAATAPPNDWNTPAFNDGAWSTGNGQLGYGDGDETTTLSYGADPQNKTISYFFRRHFTIDDPATATALHLGMLIDDGAIVYLNGTEVTRFNMPTGVVGFTTTANTGITGADESTWKNFDLPANLLVPGDNLIAVEIHQNAANSSDISFDGQLSYDVQGGTEVVGTDPVLVRTLLTDSPESYRAIFEPTSFCTLPDTVRNDLTLTAACSPYLAPGDVTVLPNVHLTVEPGVEIRMPQDANLWVLGGLDIQGDDANPVLIKPNAALGATQWGGILLKNPTAPIQLSYFKLEKASSGPQRLYFPAAISAYKANLTVDHFDGTDVLDNPLVGRYSDVTVTNSDFKLLVTGDCINIKYGHGRVENCHFEGGFAIDADGVDFDGITDGVIKNNVLRDFRGGNDDGLDIGEECHNLMIENNVIFHCSDKGISVGQKSSGTVRNNTIAYCTLGMGLKDLSQVTVDHNTFFGNAIGVSAYEKHPGDLGGIGIITNCISSNNAEVPFLSDTTASLTITNCLSDTDTLSGSNITDDPRFTAPTWYDFTLKPGSPCVGAGAGGSTIGSEYHPAFTALPQLMFSEIMYNDSLGGDGEFLEIYNPGPEAVDLTGYLISGAIDFAFPAGASIASGEYIVVAHKPELFIGLFQVFDWDNDKLANEGETILLIDPYGLNADYVRYNNHAPWPEAADHVGQSLELVSSELDDHFASSWQVGPVGGTPGAATGTVNTHTPTTAALQLALFPNPVSDRLQVLVKTSVSGRYTLQINDLQGKIMENKVLEQTGLSGAQTIDVASWPAGVYVLTMKDAAGRVVGAARFVR